MGLVNVPVRLYTMIRDQSFSFRFVREDDACPLKYQRVCTLDGEVVDWDDVARGVEIRKGEYVVFTDEELQTLRPESNKKITIDKFVKMESVDRIYFDKSYILAPDESEDAYSLLLEAFKDKGMAGVGKFTLRTKEYPVLIHVYKDALILTTLRYSNEVVDPTTMEQLQDLEEPSKDELNLALRIIESLAGEFDITEYHDTFRKEVQKLVEKKMKGETIVVEEPEKEEVRELMQALQETLSQLQEQR